MKHKSKLKKLSRPTDQRLALIKGLTAGLFAHGKVKTTDAKARAVKQYAEKVLTIAKKQDLHTRRQVLSLVPNESAVKNVYQNYLPKIMERNGGYLQLIKIPPRRGDGSKMAILAFVE